MSTKYLNWCSATEVCGDVDFPAAVYLQVPTAVMATPVGDTLGVIEGTITQVRPSSKYDTCGCCKWVYTLSYDDEDIDSDFTFAAKYIDTVLFIGGKLVLRAG